jgi:hypothetical protein
MFSWSWGKKGSGRPKKLFRDGQGISSAFWGIYVLDFAPTPIYFFDFGISPEFTFFSPAK